MLKTSQLDYNGDINEGNSTHSFHKTDLVLNKPTSHRIYISSPNPAPANRPVHRQAQFAETKGCWSPSPFPGRAQTSLPPETTPLSYTCTQPRPPDVARRAPSYGLPAMGTRAFHYCMRREVICFACSFSQSGPHMQKFGVYISITLLAFARP